MFLASCANLASSFLDIETFWNLIPDLLKEDGIARNDSHVAETVQLVACMMRHSI
jgi:hypothetical protein